MKGFVLAEAIVAAVLITTLAFSLFAFLPPYRTFIERYNRQLIAANLAREKMEEIYWNFEPPTGSSTPETIPYPVPGTGFKSFTRGYSVADDSTGKYRIIAVSVSID